VDTVKKRKKEKGRRKKEEAGRKSVKSEEGRVKG